MINKKNSLKIKIYFNWFLVNAGFCLLPIFITFIISGGFNDNIVSSSIAYSFTMLIVSFYLFDRFSEPENSFKFISIFISIILIISFVIYPELLADNHLSFLRENMIVILLLILIITLAFSFFLNLRQMNELVDRLANTTKFDEAKQTQKNIDEWIEQQKRK